MDIIVFKTNSGEEVVSYLVEKTDTALVLEKPRVLIPQQTQEGGFSLGLLPLFFSYPEGKAEVTLSNVVHMLVDDIPKQLEDAYIQQVSNIQLATA